MKVYISGKMGRPVDEEIKKKFFKVYFTLMEKHGLTPNDIVNPASDYYQAELEGTLYFGREDSELRGMNFDVYYETLLYDMSRIHLCDAIYMLKDWKDSPGARAEHAFAKAIGLEIMYEEEDSVDMSVRDVVGGLIDNAEEANAGKVFVKIQRVLKRDWDMILTVVRHKEKGAQHG